MSLFLAPIHFWLFNKIKIQEELELALVDAFKIEFGMEPIEIHDKMKDTYGNLYTEEGKALDEIIDTSNIHGWLQNAIDITERRQAHYIKALVSSYGDPAISIVDEIFSEMGGKAGTEAKEKLSDVTAPDLYNVLYDYLIDGMPCDNVRKVTESTPDKVVYEQSVCLHRKYWDEADLNAEMMYEFRFSWIKSFILQASNGEFHYDFRIISPDQTHTIYRAEI